MNLKSVLQELSGISRVEQFLPRLLKSFDKVLVCAEIVDQEVYLVFGEKLEGESSFNYSIQNKLNLQSIRKLSDEELETLDLLVSSILKSLLVIAKLRKVSYKGWQRDLSDKGVIENSESMKLCMEKVRMVAPHNTTVLLQGESGTGKEVLAKYIHRHSERSKNKFITVNCAALPETFIDSALFGHVKGAFTGAEQARKGFFEKAKGGTLFLDEIGDLPLATQSRLLRVVEYGDFSPLGSDDVMKADVRIIAASHISLKEAVFQEKFRKDLYYRLATFPIYVPALRERKEDISELTNKLLAELEKTLKLQKKPLESSFYKKALEYSWPGNIRELKNTLEQSLILSKGSKLKLVLDSCEVFQRDKLGTFDEEVKSIIETALRKSGGRVDGQEGAAELLSLKPQTLYSKIRKYEISK